MARMRDNGVCTRIFVVAGLPIASVTPGDADISHPDAATRPVVLKIRKRHESHQVRNVDEGLRPLRHVDAENPALLPDASRMKWEDHGPGGTLAFDQEHMDGLWVQRAGDPESTQHLTGPEQPDHAALCPAPGHGFGFHEQKVVECRDLIRAARGGAPCIPELAAGLQIERIVHAMATSAGRPVFLEGA